MFEIQKELPVLDPTQLTVAEAPAAAGIVTIPLNRLILSSLNVRRTERDADVASLAEDIDARGLKQNLVVTPAHFSTGEAVDETKVDWAYQLEVIAGGRRFQALQLLVADGRLPSDHPVPCMIETRGEARETSLSENLHRVAMNPADEFDAFAQIIAQLDPAGELHEPAVALCAKRFGVTVRHVAGRLRLAALAPEILDALREGKLGVESAKAYAGTTDHDLQRKIFKAQSANGWKTHDPRTVREAIRGKTLPITDPRVTFLDGLDGYLAKGGRVEAEMFMGTEGEERIVNVALFEKLVAARAEEMIPAQAKADGYKSGLFAHGTGWQLREPKAPAGFQTTYDHGDVAKAQKKKSIAIYAVAVAGDGNGLRFVRRFKPAEAAKDEGRGYKPPTPEEIAAARRKDGIAEIAARLAVGSFTGSPFEGRAFWPGKRWIDPIEQVNDDEVYVAVLVKVSPADIDAQREAAEVKYDAESADEEADRIRQASQIAAEDGVEVADALEDLESADSEADELAA